MMKMVTGGLFGAGFCVIALALVTAAQPAEAGPIVTQPTRPGGAAQLPGAQQAAGQAQRKRVALQLERLRIIRSPCRAARRAAAERRLRRGEAFLMSCVTANWRAKPGQWRARFMFIADGRVDLRALRALRGGKEPMRSCLKMMLRRMRVPPGRACLADVVIAVTRAGRQP